MAVTTAGVLAAAAVGGAALSASDSKKNAKAAKKARKSDAKREALANLINVLKGGNAQAGPLTSVPGSNTGAQITGLVGTLSSLNQLEQQKRTSEDNRRIQMARLGIDPTAADADAQYSAAADRIQADRALKKKLLQAQVGTEAARGSYLKAKEADLGILDDPNDPLGLGLFQ